MKKIFNIFTIMLSLLAFTFLTGCGQNTSSQSQSNEESQTTEENTGKKIITDQVGHEVELPNNVDRVVITSLWSCV